MRGANLVPMEAKAFDADRVGPNFHGVIFLPSHEAHGVQCEFELRRDADETSGHRLQLTVPGKNNRQNLLLRIGG